jgi:hypothetical protein
MLLPHELLGRRSQAGQLFTEPRERRCRRGILLTQALDELHDEGHRQGSSFEPLKRQSTRGFPPESQQFVCERVGVTARSATVDDLLGHAPEVLQENQAQGDWDGPQLTDREHLDLLESLDKPLERLGLEAAIGVSNEGPG